MTAPTPKPLPVFEYTLKDTGDALFDEIDAVAKAANEKYKDLNHNFHTAIGVPGDVVEHWDWFDDNFDMVLGVSIHRTTNKLYLTGNTTNIYAYFQSALFNLVDPAVGMVATQVEENPYRS